MSAADQTPTSGRSLARSSAIMASGTLVSRVLGVVRMAILAIAIGNLTDAANVWETANTIPNTIYLLLAAGVLNMLLLPQLTRAMTQGRAGQEYSDRLLTIAFTVLAVGTVLFVLATPLLTKLNALSWGWQDPKLELAILFAYICIPQMLFYGVHTTLGQVLAAHQRFAAYMWSPALANVVQIVGILIFMRRYPGAGRIPLTEWTPEMIWLLAGSATLGIVVQALVLIPAVRATGFRWRPRWGLRGVGLATVGVMALWTFGQVLISQGGMLVVNNVLNDAVDQAPRAPGRNVYFYGFSIFMLPHSLIALSLLTALYPVLSRAAATGDLRGMAVRTATGMKMLITAMVPLSVGLLLLAPLVVRVVYFGSSAAAHDAIATLVAAFSLGLVPYGIYLLCSRVFYSFEDARTPFYFQVVLTVVLMIFVGVAFVALPPQVAAVSAALGQAVGQGVTMVVAILWVRRRLPELPLRPVADTLVRALLAAVLALLPAWALVRLLDRPGTAGAVLTLGVAGVVYLAVYAVLALLLGVGEIRSVLAPVLRRVPGLRRLVPAQTPTEHTSTTPTSASVDPEAATEGTLGRDDAPGGAFSGGEDENMDRLEVGALLGDRYALEELLAEREGGGLQYWSARDVTLGRLVAVTALPAGGEHAAVAEAVLDGARRVASVDDPRLVRVLDVGEEDDLCWIVEEGLTEAESLASLVQDDTLPSEEVRRIIGEASAGLESARRRGLHHLYLNPHSVLRTTDGAVKISGVGVASALEGTDDVTADEASLIDTADLVSLLYTGLTGRWPGEDLPGVRSARRLADGTLPAPSELVGGVPGDLDALCRIVHGAVADLAAAPHTPGELARQLSPWSPDMVRGDRAGDTTAPVPTGVEPDEDATAQVPRPYYRTGDDAGHQPESPSGERSALGSAATGIGAAAAGDPPSGRDDRAPGVDRRTPGRAEATAGPLPGRHEEGLDEPRGTGLQTVAVLALILGIVGVAVLLGWAVIRGFDGGEDDTPAAPSVSAGEAEPGGAATDEPAEQSEETDAGADDAATTSDEPQEEAPIAAAGADGTVAVRGITSFDPEGDGDERNDLTPLAVDGDPETLWTSHTYLSAGWGSLKSGTGLILDLGEGATVTEVDVELGPGTMGAQLLLSETASREGATELGSGEELSETWTVTPESPATGRYLILWFTQAATTDDGELASVRDIVIR